MFFQSRNPLTGPQFKDSNIVKSFDLITALENCIFFISKYLKRLLQSTFYSWFKFPLNLTLMILEGQILVILN